MGSAHGVLSEDGHLVRQVRAGQPEAFRQLVERHWRRVYAVAYGMLGHRQDAEDAVQETFLRAYRSLDRFDTQRPLGAWLVTIAANCCRDQLSGRYRRPAPTDDLEDMAAPADSGSGQELREEVARAVRRLRPDFRVVFVLFHGQGLSYEEIAAALDKPTGTVKTWLHRARHEVLEELVRRGVLEAEPVAKSSSEDSA